MIVSTIIPKSAKSPQQAYLRDTACQTFPSQTKCSHFAITLLALRHPSHQILGTPHRTQSTRALAQVQLATSSASGEQRRGKAISDANTRNNTEPGNLRSPDQRNDGDERAIFQRLVFSLSGGVRRKKQKVSEKRNGKKEKGEQAESPYYS